MIFVKNRDGKTRKRLFYKIGDEGVVYNEERYLNEENARSNISQSLEILGEYSLNFKENAIELEKGATTVKMDKLKEIVSLYI